MTIHTSRHVHDATESRSLTLIAAATAALALHLSFAVTLIKTGTAGERLHAQRAAEAVSTVADLGRLPTITVVGRRTG